MQSLAVRFPGRYSPPHKPAGRPSVTLESDIIEFLGKRRAGAQRRLLETEASTHLKRAG
jgi:hypothetical protein